MCRKHNVLDYILQPPILLDWKCISLWYRKHLRHQACALYYLWMMDKNTQYDNFARSMHNQNKIEDFSLSSCKYLPDFKTLRASCVLLVQHLLGVIWWERTHAFRTVNETPFDMHSCKYLVGGGFKTQSSSPARALLQW